MMRKGLFGKGMGFGGGIVATPEQGEETRRLEAMFPNAGGMPASLPDMAQIPTTAGGAFGDPMASQPQRKPGLGTRLLGQGWEGKVAALGASLMGDRSAVPDYFQGQQLLQARAAEQAAALRQAALERAQGLEDYLTKKQIDQQFDEGPEIGIFEDNAGNRYRFNKRTGDMIDNKPYFIDPNPRQYLQDGVLITVPNTYGGQQPQGGQDAPDTLPADFFSPGGTGGDAGGNFR
jgi:hypothetical protein